MLAQDYAKHGKKIKWPVGVNAKLDGGRCCTTLVDGKPSYKSRKNKPFNVLSHLDDSVIEIIEFLKKEAKTDEVILDGEIYVHGWNFQDIISALKRDEPNEESVKLE